MMNLGTAIRPMAWLVVAVACLLFAANSAEAQDSQTPQDGPGTTPVSGRQPTVTNQFTAATGGAIQNRRPGLYVQQAIGVHGGNTSWFTGVPDEAPNFFRDTMEQIMQEIFNVVQGLMDGIQLFVSSLAGQTSTPGQAAFVPIQNAATTGQGTSTQIQ